MHIENDKELVEVNKEMNLVNFPTEKQRGTRFSESSTQELEVNFESGNAELRGRSDLVEATNFESFGPTDQQLRHHEDLLVTSENATFGTVKEESIIQETSRIQEESRIQEREDDKHQEEEENLDEAEEKLQKAEVKPGHELRKDAAKDIFNDLNARLDRINELDRFFEEKQKGLNDRIRKIQQEYQQRAISSASTPVNPRSMDLIPAAPTSLKTSREIITPQMKDVRRIEPHELLNRQRSENNEANFQNPPIFTATDKASSHSQPLPDINLLKNSGNLNTPLRESTEFQARMVLDPLKSSQPMPFLRSEQQLPKFKPEAQKSKGFESAGMTKEPSPNYSGFDEGDPQIPERKINDSPAKFKPAEIKGGAEIKIISDMVPLKEESESKEQSPMPQEDKRIEEEFVISSVQKTLIEQKELPEKNGLLREKQKAVAPQQENSDDDSDDSVEIYDINFSKMKPSVLIQEVGFQQTNPLSISTSASGSNLLKSKQPTVSQSQKQIRVLPKKEQAKSSLFFSPNNSNRAKIWEDERKSFNEAILLRERQSESYLESKIPQKSSEKAAETQIKSFKPPSREKVKSSGYPGPSIREERNVDGDQNNAKIAIEEPRIISRVQNDNEFQNYTFKPPSKEKLKRSENPGPSIIDESSLGQTIQNNDVHIFEEEQIIPRKQNLSPQNKKRTDNPSSKHQSPPKSEPKKRKQSPNKNQYSDSNRQQQGHFQVSSTQQPLYPQPYGQNLYGTPYQQPIGTGFPHAFPMSPVMNNPYQLAGTPGYFGQPLPIQTFPVYSPEAFVNKWVLREEASTKQPNHSTPIIINNNIISPDKGVEYQGTKEHQGNKQSPQTERKTEKSKDRVLNDFLKEQEDFLKQLDADKRSKRERIEREKTQSDDLSHSREDSYNSPLKTRLNHQPHNVTGWDQSIPEEVDEGEPRLNNSSQLKRSSSQNKWAMRDRQASDKEDSQSPERSPIPNIDYPRGEAYEIVWGEYNQSQADLLKKRKRGLEERLDHQKQFSTKPDRHPEKTKEELIQLRKQMMKSRGTGYSQDRYGNRSLTPGTGSDTPLSTGRVFRSRSPESLAFEVRGYKRSKSREPNPELIERLAAGKRAQISKEEMYRLNQKNYEMLPEVRMKRELHRKNEEERQRKEKMRNMDQKFREVGYKHYYQPFQ